jgi:hypothetical protein
MLRLIEHLLPRSIAWTLQPGPHEGRIGKRLRQYFEGLAGLPHDIRIFIDRVLLDVFPDTTRELAAWETQFGLRPGGSEPERRAKLEQAWSMSGGQSPDYIQRTIQDAGFTDVFVHEWWASGPPYVARNPFDYIGELLIGTYQCEGSTPWECFDPAPGQPLAPHCDDTLVSDPGYIVNLDLTRRAPPPMPTDPARWPYVLYLAGETFPDPALVPASRVAELKELILRVKPTQQWIVLIITEVAEFDGFGSSDFGGAPAGA